MNILSEMSSIYYELTISEKRIAEYILEPQIASASWTAAR